MSEFHRFGPFELRPASRMLLKDGAPLELGARAFDLLVSLVDHRDRVVPKSELMDLVWPDVVVEENNLQVQVSALRKLLGPEAIKTVPGRGYQFLGDGVVRPTAQGSPRAHGLPEPLTSFVGRERELAECEQLIVASRLLTLTGIGGTGKTRLAVELARRRHHAIAEHVVFVDLAPVGSADRIATTIGTMLGVREGPEQTIIAAVCQNLASRTCLLVLDNCEHLSGACADIVTTVLANAASARVIATSRERLGITGEQVVRLPPLSVAEANPRAGSETTSEAARLFVERARLADPHFGLDPDALRVVEEVCRGLEGLPLAIELAAARVNVLPVDAIRDRLCDRFRLLSGDARLPTRHRTMRGVLDWSYDQLEPSVRQALGRLAVFAGGWTLDAAAFVLACDEFDAIERLATLVDKSLVLMECIAGGARYRMLETVRSYARERAGDDVREALQRHRRYFVDLVARLPPRAAAEEHEAFARLDVEFDNLLAVHDSFDGDPQAAPVGLRLVAGLSDYFTNRTHLRLARAMIDHALARPGLDPNGPERAGGLVAAGSLAFDLGDLDAATTCFREALPLAERAGNANLQLPCLRHLGALASEQGHLAQSRSFAGRALALARVRGMAYQEAGALCDLGELCRIEGDLASATRYYEASLAIYREHRFKRSAIPTLNLSIVANEHGDYRRAAALVAEASSEAHAGRSPYLHWCVLQHAAALAAAVGDAPFAARMWGAFEAARAASGLAMQRADQPFLSARIQRARRALGEARFEQSRADGATLSSGAAIVEVDDWLDDFLGRDDAAAPPAVRP